MPRKATTFRIDPTVRAGLFQLSDVLHRPANQLANEALKEYVDRRIVELAHDLESTLADLRAYQKGDPDFERSIAQFVDAEVRLEHDPAEGKSVAPKRSSRKPARA